MSTAKFIPATPAVTQVVTPEVPAKVVLELDVEDASRLRALVGRSRPGHLDSVFKDLQGLAELGLIADRRLSRAQPPISLDY
jgi:hypothetical protein